MNKSNVFVVENAKQVRKESEKIKVMLTENLQVLSLRLVGAQSCAGDRGGERGWSELPQLLTCRRAAPREGLSCL